VPLQLAAAMRPHSHVCASRAAAISPACAAGQTEWGVVGFGARCCCGPCVRMWGRPPGTAPQPRSITHWLAAPPPPHTPTHTQTTAPAWRRLCGRSCLPGVTRRAMLAAATARRSSLITLHFAGRPLVRCARRTCQAASTRSSLFICPSNSSIKSVFSAGKLPAGGHHS
jgi:hypothetical protein